MGCVYQLFNTCTGMSYIGYTTCSLKVRIRKHKNDDPKNPNLLIGKAIAEYGFGYFTYWPLYESDNVEELMEKERFYIKELNTLAPNGYNMTVGGVKLCGEENPFYGKRHTEETKKRLTEIRRGYTGEANAFYGRHHSDKTKAMLREKNSKPVVAIKDGEVYKRFDSILSASRWCIKQGLTKSAYSNSEICARCRDGNKSYGYHWQYANNEGVETMTDECRSVG